MDYRIGCSGWSYKHWRDDFYPKGLPTSRWLPHYISVFDTVELNTTFYRLPSENAVRHWLELAPAGFCFAAKVSRLITHFLRLANCAEALKTYLERITLLEDRLGPLLYQLPPDFERDDERLNHFLDLLPSGLTHVFEFRNQSWWVEPVFEKLREHHISFCAYDAGTVQTPVAATGQAAYVRFHGPVGNPAIGYSDEQLLRWIEQVGGTGSETAWIYFNNDVGGHAPRNALRFKELMGLRVK